MFNFFGEVKEKLKTSGIVDSFNIINLSGQLIYVEGHMGLLTLSKEQISFKIKNGAVIIEGADMLLLEMSENTLKISGKIKKMEQI